MNIFTGISAVAGLVLVSAGTAMVYRPLGFITAGALLLAAAFVSANRRRRPGA
jgi:preprotein translocase subunit SecD